VADHELTGKTFPLLRSEPADQECPCALLPNVGGLGVQPEEFVEGFPPRPKLGLSICPLVAVVRWKGKRGAETSSRCFSEVNFLDKEICERTVFRDHDATFGLTRQRRLIGRTVTYSHPGARMNLRAALSGYPTFSSMNSTPASRRLAMRMGGGLCEIEIHRLLFFLARRRPVRRPGRGGDPVRLSLEPHPLPFFQLPLP
jgi:hypothetical protein